MEKKAVSDNVGSHCDGYWERFERNEPPPYEITGKYLFFSTEREVLVQIAVGALERGGFHRAKIQMEGKNFSADYVLCLYYKDDSRKGELARRYRSQQNVRYRYWKSDEDTRRGKYSDNFLKELPSALSRAFRQGSGGAEKIAEKSQTRVALRPGITHPRFWFPNRPPEAEWKRIRQIVMERDDWTCASCGHRALKWMHAHHLGDSGDNSPENLVPLCVACHTVYHVGRSLMHGVVEIWESGISQVEIVRRTREGIRQGLSLAAIKDHLPLGHGPHPPNSVEYANDLIDRMGKASRAYLDEPLCAVFVNLDRWQIED